MHIFISGIAGSGLSSLAHLCLDLGFKVSGSDLSSNKSVDFLIQRGLAFQVDQRPEFLVAQNELQPIDFYIHTPALPKNSDEILAAEKLGLKIGKQNLLINFILQEKNLKLIAVAGTHGKTTTTAMISWLFQSLKIPVSHIIGSNISFGNSGQWQENSQYLVYEADEYDKKFLDLQPDISLITSLDWDHPDIYPTQKSYLEAFGQFCNQSKEIIAFENVRAKLETYILGAKNQNSDLKINSKIEQDINILSEIKLPGLHNRQNAFLALYAMFLALNPNQEKSFIQTLLDFDLINFINQFPGTSRRFERLLENLHSDYAHHPTEIKATLQLAKEFISNHKPSQKLIVVYQPHQNSRQHELLEQYQDCFDQADCVYWLPTFLSRENPELKILNPEEIYAHVNPKIEIKPFEFNNQLLEQVKNDLKEGSFVLILGAGTIDDWFRKQLPSFI